MLTSGSTTNQKTAKVCLDVNGKDAQAGPGDSQNAFLDHQKIWDLVTTVARSLSCFA